MNDFDKFMIHEELKKIYPEFDDTFEIIFYDDYSSYEDWRFLCIISKDSKYYKLEEMDSPEAEKIVNNWENNCSEISFEEAAQEIEEWDEFLKLIR